MTALPLTETLNELTHLCQYFKDAEESLKAGKIADMTGIDARVSAVCQTVQKAIPEQQQQYLPELTVLINLLDSYERALRDLHTAATESQREADAQS